MEMKEKRRTATAATGRRRACISSTTLPKYSATSFSTTEGGGISLSYLKEQGFREDIIRKFQLGYCPEQSNAFARAAVAALPTLTTSNDPGCSADAGPACWTITGDGSFSPYTTSVKLVLILDKEELDSYVRKVGAAAFSDFVAAANKKDFILFQLEVALKDAAGDSNKKAGVVNQVAETISKINKAEDFTRQQDYIRQCAELLKIGEEGLQYPRQQIYPGTGIQTGE